MEQIANLSTGNCRQGSSPCLSAGHKLQLITIRGVAQPGYRATFGTWRPQVRILPPRLKFLRLFESTFRLSLIYFVYLFLFCNKHDNQFGVQRSPVIAPRLGRGGRRFESCHPDIISRYTKSTGPQLSWIEHLPSKEAVIGSNPIGLTKLEN